MPLDAWRAEGLRRPILCVKSSSDKAILNAEIPIGSTSHGLLVLFAASRSDWLRMGHVFRTGSEKAKVCCWNRKSLPGVLWVGNSVY